MFLVSVLNFQRLTLDFQDVQQSNPGKKIWKYFKYSKIQITNLNSTLLEKSEKQNSWRLQIRSF